MKAAERFRQGEEGTVIAHDLQVSVRSVQRRRMDVLAVLEHELAQGHVTRAPRFVGAPPWEPFWEPTRSRALF
ncbi:hypothetical protein GCM10010297_58880 [Streptomyces malachitofuscus]|nr:hypothetical protein GCM10010297_58880 [Streptomyces malachitofuscus]